MRQQWNCINNTLGLKRRLAARLNINQDMIHAEVTWAACSAWSYEQLAAGWGEDKQELLIYHPEYPRLYQNHKTITAKENSDIMDLHPSSSNRVNSLVHITVILQRRIVFHFFDRNLLFFFQDEAIRKDSTSNSFCQNFSKFATTTSAHGFAYTVEGPILRRVVSVVIVIAFVTVAGNFTYFAIRFQRRTKN